MTDKKRCFVVMGFGKKTDLATGRLLDLDKTYRIIIKQAVEECGVECIRADDIIHSGLIDVPMYELLLKADLVIADLSTANPNALYELGVRHALRPHTTIVMAEDQFKSPFDVSHILIRPYQHLGPGIDAEEAATVREGLKKAIVKLLDQPDVDSPVYRFLPDLREWNTLVAAQQQQAAPAAAAAAKEDDSGTVTELTAMFHEAKAASQWTMAASMLERILKRRPDDVYLTQQLALATYKSKKPDPIGALEAAKAILQKLQPQTSTDPETLGLWGAIHKRLYELTSERAHLDEAIRAYAKGFYVKNDYYNGINFAFLLNVRAAVSEARDAQADVVWAERVRNEVYEAGKQALAVKAKDNEPDDPDETFWINASMVEALAGSGRKAEADALRASIVPTARESWMVETMDGQLQKLDALLAAAPRM